MSDARLLAIVILAPAAVACTIDPFPARTSHDAAAAVGGAAGGDSGASHDAGDTASSHPDSSTPMSPDLGADTLANGGTGPDTGTATGGTGGAIGTDGGLVAADAPTTTGADALPDVPLGGSGGTSGTTATGGMTATGGITSVGGTGTAGTLGGTGGTATGGAVIGGSMATGGTTGTGGTTTTGGTATTGVTTAGGGTTSGGGTMIAGGTTASGGATSAGGAANTGGNAATGGMTSCTHETDLAFCARLGKNCGLLTAADDCGALRTADSCGMCGGTTPACEDNVCKRDVGSFVPSSAHSCSASTGNLGLCHGESCCTSIVVPSGTFPMGRSLSGVDQYPNPWAAPEEQPEHSVTVSKFALDKYEVTVGRFREFVSAYVDSTMSAPAVASGAIPNIAESGWNSNWNAILPATQSAFKDASHLKCDSTTWQNDTWTDEVGSNENLAINCVNWYEAFAFCIWDGGRLPTEAEWEYVAAGGAENRLFPWGSAAADCDHLNFNTGTVGYCAGGKVTPVGSYSGGNGFWGHSDLAGNVWEWTLDWFDAAWYSGAGAVCNDCAACSSGSRRVIRGGSYYDTPSVVRVAARYSNSPADRISGGGANVGIRCARNPL
jgi:formylglycine-generating enzyme required for sulfatase activity